MKQEKQKEEAADKARIEQEKKTAQLNAELETKKAELAAIEEAKRVKAANLFEANRIKAEELDRINKAFAAKRDQVANLKEDDELGSLFKKEFLARLDNLDDNDREYFVNNPNAYSDLWSKAREDAEEKLFEKIRDQQKEYLWETSKGLGNAALETGKNFFTETWKKGKLLTAKPAVKEPVGTKSEVKEEDKVAE